MPRKFGFITILAALILSACGSFTQATDTPEPTSTPAPTPVGGMLIYTSDALEVGLKYPAGWFISEANNFLIISTRLDYTSGATPESIDEGECRIVLFITSKEVQTQYGDPIGAMKSYKTFGNVPMPEKEPAHIVKLNGKDYAFGTYSQEQITGKNIPLFTSMRFTANNTIVTELYASAKDEAKFRKTFETILGSIEIASTVNAASPSSAKKDFADKLIADGDILGWYEPTDNEEVFADGMCHILLSEKTQDYVLVNCIFYKSENRNLEKARSVFTTDESIIFINLEKESQYTYADNYDLYAYLDLSGYPEYSLLLETDSFVYSVTLVTPQMPVAGGLEKGIHERFGKEIDDLLHEGLLVNLQKSK